MAGFVIGLSVFVCFAFRDDYVPLCPLHVCCLERSGDSCSLAIPPLQPCAAAVLVIRISALCCIYHCVLLFYVRIQSYISCNLDAMQHHLLAYRTLFYLNSMMFFNVFVEWRII